MRYAIGFVLLAVVLGIAYVRLAPHDVTQAHQLIDAQDDADFPNGAVRVFPASMGQFQAADSYLRSLPRTHVVAGSLAERHITYVTRSLVFGFPDYTTLEVRDGTLRAYARLRFGKSDLGVNRKRLEGLMSAIQGG